MDERFYDAYQRIWEPPGTDEVRVQMGQELSLIHISDGA
ncbi:hypothetical protein C499_00385, partial [Halogeometricum borinquense DSM 11551]